MISIKNLCLQQGFLHPLLFFPQSVDELVQSLMETFLNPLSSSFLSFFFFLPLQMIQLTSVLVSSVEIAPLACTMASSRARAARASSSAASATSACTAAAATRTARCRASSATAASTVACSSVCKWGWTAKVKCGHTDGFQFSLWQVVAPSGRTIKQPSNTWTHSV